MFIKNNSKRLITINFKKGNIKIIPTRTASITSEQAEEMKKMKVVMAWFKDKDLEEVKEKAELTAEMVAYSSSEDLDANYNIKELKAFAQSIELPGYSNLDKAELIALLKKEKEG